MMIIIIVLSHVLSPLLRFSLDKSVGVFSFDKTVSLDVSSI